MNKTNRELLNRFSKKEYRTFLRNALGFKVFNALNRDSNVVLRSKKGKTNDSNAIKNKERTYIAYLYNGNSLVDAYYYTNSLFDNKKFIKETEGEKDAFTYFDVLKDDIILFLLLSSKDNFNSSYIFNGMTVDAYPITESIDINAFNYSFILGTGISSCFSVKNGTN